jgi:hypothetical protein
VAQNVSLEQTPIGPPGSTWSIGGGNTNMTSTASGSYLVNYRIDYFSGNGDLQAASSAGVYLTLNNALVPGSGTLVIQPDANHQYTISNTVIMNYTAGQNLNLRFITNLSPLASASLGSTKPGNAGWATFQESVATIVITRIA